MKIALVYDRVNKWGGAERVLLTLHEMFPEAPLYTSVYDKNAKWAEVFPQVIPSYLQRLKFIKKNHEYFAYLMPNAFESFDFKGYDVVISITSEAAKGIITDSNTKHICYCLTPTRYLWSAYDEYFQNKNLKTLSKPIIKYLRKWDLQASGRPDKLISISSEVKNRIKKFYNRDSQIIFPPLNIPAKNVTAEKRKDYFLVVTRLVPYKKIDLVIQAFNELGLPLVIIGEGRQKSFLQRMSKDNIKFTGYVSDEELINYYKNARALIFPQIEDFGLVSIEAQAYGMPVIAYKSGGALDTVIENVTGLFFDRQDSDSIIRTIENFNEKKFNIRDITNNAKRFSKENFKREFLSIL